MSLTVEVTDPKAKYEMLEILGEGVFGRVAKCCNRASKEIVALKLIKKNGEKKLKSFWRELEMLDCIKVLDPDIFNLVKFIEYFDSEDCPSIVFELLDMSVSDLMWEQTTFSLNQIRPMTKQMLVALQGLQSIGVMHTDIKTDNIMLVNHEEQPFKVKLIDFGLAMCCDQVFTGQTIQPITFRAPEVTLGLPLTEAVDVWSLAFCLLSWCQESEDFLSSSNFDNLTKVVHFLGTPANRLLKKGLHTWKYFVPENNSWRLKTLQEFKTTMGITPEMSEDPPSASNLEELIKGSKAPQSDEESCDTDAFLDLVRKMLEIDPKKRITPTEALLHPFITMEPLSRETKYFKEAKELMRVAETEECNTKLEDVVKLLQKGEATEAELPKVSQKASRFTKLILRPLRVFFSRLFKQPRPKKPFFKK